MTVSKFLKHQKACKEGFKWATDNCSTMQDVWDTAKPDWLIWLATREGVCDEKMVHRFSCFCVREIWHLLKDERSKKAIEVKEKWIDGLVSDSELKDAAADAADAADAAAAAYAAAAYAAAAADAAAYAAAAADAAADAAAYAAAAADADAAAAAAADAAKKKQAKWLRDNCKPNFDIMK
jgi:hypothetical protein